MKNTWKSINVNKNLIKAESGMATLIGLPHSSSYDGYAFWHPSRLVKEGRHSAAISISYNEQFEFVLKKYNKRYEVVDELSIDANEFEIIFGIIDENINAAANPNYYETHIPEMLQAEKTVALEDLKDD